jgi:hypothetical protein
VAFGAEKLDWGLRYIARTPADEAPKDIPELTIEIPKNGGVTRKPFAETTVADLRSATSAQRGAKKPSIGGPLPPTLQKDLARINNEVDKTVGAPHAASAYVTARTGEKSTLLDVMGIPYHLAKRVLRVVATGLS